MLRGIGPGRPRIRGPIWIEERATGAQLLGVSLTSNSPTSSEPLKVQADRARIAGNSIAGSMNASCILVGSQRTTRGVAIERNHIRHCGRHGKLDHLIYLEHTRATTIRGNLLTDNFGGWAVHLYPDADGTSIERNIIDGNLGGVVIAGVDGQTSTGNAIRNNAITYSSPRRNVESSWEDGPAGQRNRVSANCLLSRGPDAPAGIGYAEGFSVGPNTVLDRSPYVNRATGDFRFRAASPCAELVGDVVGGLPRGLPPQSR